MCVNAQTATYIWFSIDGLEFPLEEATMPSNPLPRVLCVEDDEDAAEMLTLLMKSQGIEVSCAPSAAEAWVKIRAESFELLVLDVWLPGLGGFEFCRQLREFGFIAPILFYSGASTKLDREKGIAAGANAYLLKPDIEGLIETVVALIVKPKQVGTTARVGKRRRLAASALSSLFLAVIRVLN
jgi:DNA-binding response OmpR family regulator